MYNMFYSSFISFLLPAAIVVVAGTSPSVSVLIQKLSLLKTTRFAFISPWTTLVPSWNKVPFYYPVPFDHLFWRFLINNVYSVTSSCCLQGSPGQEERNGPLPPPKPQEPSSNHTAPVPGELRGLHISDYILQYSFTFCLLFCFFISKLRWTCNSLTASLKYLLRLLLLGELINGISGVSVEQASKG